VLTNLYQSARAGEPSTDDARETARLHYARGLELAGQADYEAALREFTEAYRVSPHFAVLYNIGQAEFALGHPAEAIESLSRYLRDGQEQVPPARRQDVQAQIALLESLFAEVTISTDQSGALITVDGREVGRTPLYQPIRLPTGTHKVSATLEGMAAIDRTVTLAPGDRQVLNLGMPPHSELSKVAEGQPSPSPVSTKVGTDAQAEPTAKEGMGQTLIRDQRREPLAPGPSRRMSILGYSSAGLGVALAGAALGVYLWNRGRYSDWQAGDAALKNETMGTAAYRERARANNSLAASLTRTNHLISGLSIGSGALVAAGAALLYINHTRRDRKSTLSFGWGGGSSANIFWSRSW
jgi:tetratricopeptide (TPR) repeat protein